MQRLIICMFVVIICFSFSISKGYADISRLQSDGKIVTLEIEAKPVALKDESGMSVEAWGFCLKGETPALPGPAIKVKEGTKIRVCFTNMLPVPASIELCGIKRNTSGDGVYISENPACIIESGDAGVFYWDTTASPGTWFYHAHTFGMSGEASRGLCGALIVEPEEADSDPPDREFVVFVNTFFDTIQEYVCDDALGKTPLTNGLIWEAKLGEKVRFHLINASEETHNFIVHDHPWIDRVSGECVNDISLPPFSSYVADFTAGRNVGPGHWEFHFRDSMMNSLTGTFVVDKGNMQTPTPVNTPPTLDDYTGTFLYIDPALKAVYEDFIGLEKGDGPWADYYAPIPIYQYFNPARHYTPPDSDDYKKLLKTFSPDQCVECHEIASPAIVNEWKMSVHASPRRDPHLAAETREIEDLIGKVLNNWSSGTKDGVYCSYCHGEDHEELFMPTVDNSCGACHPKQAGEFMKGREYGRPNHPQSWEGSVSVPWYAELYRKGEGFLMVGCDQCHQNMSSCDECHYSHGFSAAQARRPEVCSGCHMGPDHPDWESYERSKWGIIYETTGENWNWEKKLSEVVPGVDYASPTCQYCHMYVGDNQWEMHVESKGIWRMGVIPPVEVDFKSGLKDFPYGIKIPPMDRKLEIYSAENKEKRRIWIELCSKCHSNRFAAMWLDSLDEYMFASWKRIDEAQLILENLFADGIIQPPPGQRPPFPLSDVIPEALGPENLGTEMYNLFKKTGGHIPVIGPVLGVYGIFTQTGSNPAGIEREFVEMWFWDHLQGYKGTAHAQQDLSWWWGAAGTGGRFARIQEEAAKLRRLKAIEDAVIQQNR